MNRLLLPVRTIASWPTRSQHVACRNAMVASTLLTERRLEINEVEDFLDRFYGRTPARETPAPETRHAVI